MAQGSSIGDFFFGLFFNVDEKSKKDAEGALSGIKDKFHELAKEAFEFNELREAIESIIEPIKGAFEAVAEIAEKADALNNLASVVGSTTQNLERLQFMANLADASVESMNHAMVILSRNMAEADSGGKEQIETFKKLGISIHDANGKLRDSGELMPELIGKFSEIPSKSERIKVAQEALGRGALELLPLLNKEAEELQEIARSFDELGGAFSEEYVERSAKFADNMKLMTFSFNNMKRELSTSLIPAFSSFIEIWLNFARSNWPEIASIMRSIGDTLADVFMKTAGTAFDTFLKYLKDLAKNKDAIDFISTALKVLGVVLLTYFSVKSPGMLGIALLAAFIEDLMGAMEGKDSLVGRFALGLEEMGKQAGILGKTIRFLSDAWKDFKTGLQWIGTGFSKDPEVLKAIRDARENDTSTLDDLAFQQRHIEMEQKLDAIADPRERAREWRRMNGRLTESDLIDESPALVPVGGGGGSSKKITNHMTFHVKADNPEEAARKMKRIINDHNSEAMRDVGTEGQ